MPHSTVGRRARRRGLIERAIRFVDGVAIILTLVAGLALLWEALEAGDDPDLLLSGILVIVLGLSFVLPYLGMRYRASWRWPAHLLPLLAAWWLVLFRLGAVF